MCVHLYMKSDECGDWGIGGLCQRVSVIWKMLVVVVLLVSDSSMQYDQ